MYIIPTIDILNGKVVRLKEGKYDQVTEYNVSLEEMVEQFSSNGTDFVQIIDLNGAKGDFSNQKFIIDVLKKSSLKIQYGGGVRSIEKVKELIDLGFHRVIIGTQAIKDEHFLEDLSKEVCGKAACADKVIIALDILNGVIKHSGWIESSNIKPLDHINNCISMGYFRFLCTDISKNGRMEGSSIEFYKQLKEHFPFIKIIGSGGISSITDIHRLQELKLEAFVIGKAIYEGKVKIEEIKDWNLQTLISL